MGINIGDNNKIIKSTIGNNGKKSRENSLFRIIIEIIIGIIVGLIVGFCVYKFGWNK